MNIINQLKAIKYLIIIVVLYNSYDSVSNSYVKHKFDNNNKNILKYVIQKYLNV